MRSNSVSMADSASLFCSCLHNAGKAINLTSFFGTLGNRLLFSDCSYIIKHICEYVNNKPPNPQTRFNSSVGLLEKVEQGVGLQETAAKKHDLPVVTFYSPPPPSEPASHRRFRHQPRSHSPTHLHTTALPNLSDFLPPRLPPKPEPLHAPFCTNSPTPHPNTRHIPQKFHPQPTLYILHKCSISNIFKNNTSQALDICTPI